MSIKSESALGNYWELIRSQEATEYMDVQYHGLTRSQVQSLPLRNLTGLGSAVLSHTGP